MAAAAALAKAARSYPRPHPGTSTLAPLPALKAFLTVWSSSSSLSSAGLEALASKRGLSSESQTVVQRSLSLKADGDCIVAFEGERGLRGTFALGSW